MKFSGRRILLASLALSVSLFFFLFHDSPRAAQRAVPQPEGRSGVVASGNTASNHAGHWVAIGRLSKTNSDSPTPETSPSPAPPQSGSTLRLDAVIDPMLGKLEVEEIGGTTANGVTAIRVGSDWGFVDKDGNLLCRPQFYFEYGFDEQGIAVVQAHDRKWGYLRTDCSFLIEPIFDIAYAFWEDRALVKMDGLYGFVNREGKYAISPRFDFAKPFSNGIATVTYDGKTYYVDYEGNPVQPPGE